MSCESSTVSDSFFERLYDGMCGSCSDVAGTVYRAVAFGDYPYILGLYAWSTVGYEIDGRDETSDARACGALGVYELAPTGC